MPKKVKNILKNKIVPVITAIIGENIKNVSFKKNYYGQNVRVYSETISPEFLFDE